MASMTASSNVLPLMARALSLSTAWEVVMDLRLSNHETEPGKKPR
jgi:hypothetical protein